MARAATSGVVGATVGVAAVAGAAPGAKPADASAPARASDAASDATNRAILLTMWKDLIAGGGDEDRLGQRDEWAMWPG